MPKKEVKILYANVRGLRSKIDSLQAAILLYEPDLVMLVETHIIGKSRITIKGYKETILRNRKTKGGGLLIAKSDKSKINLTAIKIHETEEHLWAKINNTIVCLAYAPIESRSDKNSLEEWYFELEKEYTKWDDHKVLIIGDFNAKIGTGEGGIEGNHPELSISGKILKNFNERRNLYIMNNEKITKGKWTREDPNGTKSILDYIISNEDLKPQITNIIIDEEHNYKLSRYRKLKGTKSEIKSDHNTILIKVMETKNSNKAVKNQMWNIKNPEAWENFKKDTENIKIKESWNNQKEINEGYKKWSNQLKSLMYKHFERITIKNNTITTRKIRNLTNRRKALSKEIGNMQKSNINNGVVIKYLVNKQKSLKSQVTEELENKRTERIKNRLAKLISKSAIINGIWKVRKENWGPSEMNMGIKSKDGYLLTDHQDINERYKEYYEELLLNRRTKEEYEKHQRIIEENHKIYMKITSFDQDPINQEITRNELEKAIKTLKKEKSPGPDEIYNEILINAGKNLKESLLKMINVFWKTEQLPEELYKVEIKSIYKGKGDIGNLENHRGIFLNSNITKLIEKIILLRGTEIIENNTSQYQAGGRSNYSTGEQVFILRSIIDKCNYFNQPIFLQFIDLKKAFDKMVIKNILQNLWEIGIRGKIWRMIHKINEKAIIRIKMNSGTTTDEFTTGEILKQGSVLAANLAAFHTDTLARKFCNKNLGIDYGKINVPLLLFQDDVVKFDKTAHNLQISNIILESYQNENKMEYHPTKTMIMTNSQIPPNIILNNLSVPITKEYKYLGDIVTIDNKLQPLIWERKNLITGTVAELITILNQTRQFSILAAVQYLEGIIIPKMLLNSETWTQITDEDQSQLEQIQSQSIKRMLHLPYSTPTRGLYSELGIMTIRNQIAKRQLLFLHKIMNKPDHTLSKNIMREQENLPGNNWLKQTKKTLEELKIDDQIDEIIKIPKAQWKKIVKDAIIKKEIEDFETFKNTSKKCKHLKTIEQKSYIKVLTPEKAKLILEIRLGILDVKENYHGKFQDNTCRKCKKEIETAEHFFKCNSKDSAIENLDEIWKLENINKLEEVAEHCLKLLEENEYIEYKKI